MCNRFAFAASPEEVAEMRAALGLDEAGLPALEPRYNIAPTQPIAVVRTAADGQRELALVRWSLIPSWHRGEKPPFLTNARAETVAEKPSFRAAFKSRRCVIPATGFYEWEHVGKAKNPFFLRRRGPGLLFLAGLWDRWHGPDGPIDSAAILTVEANDLMRPIHDRMPAVLPSDRLDAWLDPREERAPTLLELLAPCPSEQMECSAADKSALAFTPRSQK